jgi:peptidyl-prolyl cis-trans isomerase SurA
MKKIITACTLLSFMFSAQAQSNKDIILTIEDTPIHKQEFLRVYKKNLDLVKDTSQKSVDGYLQLFVDYKLKVQEAYAQGLHKNPAYKKEFEKYRAQLSRNYLFEEKIEEDMAKEAYVRSQEQISAQHVLIMVGYDALPQDTLQAYNTARGVYQKAKNEEDFTALVLQYSEEPNVKESKGELGYFTAFSMLYPFENAAYNTKIGEISDITRTSYGYHVIKVLDRRPTGNEITVSHIMVAPKKEDPDFNAEVRINELYQLISQGEKFEDIAKQFSEDKNSGVSGGKLKPFTKGKLRAPKFENAAFALQNPGEISKPIQSSFGWHIIRLEQVSEEKSYKEQRERLLAQGNRGERLMAVTSEIRSKIKAKYGYENDATYASFFNDFVDKEIFNRRWKYDTLNTNLDKVIFSIGISDFYYRDFAAHLAIRQKRPVPTTVKTIESIVGYMYDDFETVTLQDYFRDKLEEENLDYAAIISEYRDGLLIFEVMEKNIWNEAKTDTLALQNYYNANVARYSWEDRMRATILTSNEKAALDESKKLLEQGKTAEEVKELLNKQGDLRVLLSKGVFEKGAKQLPSTSKFVTGVSDVYKIDTGFTLLQVDEVLLSTNKSFDEVRGRVMSEYQSELEATWVQNLRDKYNIKINKKTLKKIKKELKKELKK